ncbi:MAG TPA: UPF0147 family protein [Candidatus Nanoarchaeia archaeon]|nr:UPF0147 family protein [Candidatus Nanoarchaeia archaeon]
MGQSEQLDALTDIISVLNEISLDSNVPRNVRAKMGEIQAMLNSAREDSVKLHDAMHALDEVSTDANLDSFSRTQVYSLISMLEKLK